MIFRLPMYVDKEMGDFEGCLTVHLPHEIK